MTYEMSLALKRLAQAQEDVKELEAAEKAVAVCNWVYERSEGYIRRRADEIRNTCLYDFTQNLLEEVAHLEEVVKERSLLARKGVL